MISETRINIHVPVQSINQSINQSNYQSIRHKTEFAINFKKYVA